MLPLSKVEQFIRRHLRYNVTQVMLGQGFVPEQYHPVVNVMSQDELTRFMHGIKAKVEKTVASLPRHQVYVAQYCRAAGQ